MNFLVVALLIIFFLNFYLNLGILIKQNRREAVEDQLRKDTLEITHHVLFFTKEEWDDFKKNVDLQDRKAYTILRNGDKRFVVKVLK